MAWAARDSRRAALARLRSRGYSGQPGENSQLADRGPAEGQPKHRERHHTAIFASLAAVHRPTGTGEQVGQEHGVWIALVDGCTLTSRELSNHVF